MDDWLSTMQMSNCSASATRSMGSSLLTVSDLEEDLRAASAFLSSNNKRTSSIFTDSTDDLSSLAEDFQGGSVGASDPTSALAVMKPTASTGYEKDIRDIVEYFEASCRVSRPRISHHHHIRLQKLHSGTYFNFLVFLLLTKGVHFGLSLHFCYLFRRTFRSLECSN